MRIPIALTLSFLSSPFARADFELSHATNQLGLQLYRTIAPGVPAGNVVLSPYSIESALALVYAGADGMTRTEMSRVLGLPDDDATVSAACAGLRTSLDEIAAQSKATAEARARHGGKLDSIAWHAANRLFGQQGYAFRDSFLTSMRDRYAAPFEALDFHANPEAGRLTINRWVEEQTRDKIRNLIPSGALNTDTRLVLVNALYLKAPWQTPFEKAATQRQPFHLPGGDREVPMMRRTAMLGYAREEGLTVVTLDYVGNGLQFVVILPDEGASPDALAAKLAPAYFARWAKLGDGKRTNVALSLPKFRLEGSTMPLGPALRTLGIRSAFDEPTGSANFDRIAPRKPNDYLAVSEVFHQTFLAVDEEGTEAAAATAAVMMMLGAIARPSRCGSIGPSSSRFNTAPAAPACSSAGFPIRTERWMATSRRRRDRSPPRERRNIPALTRRDAKGRTQRQQGPHGAEAGVTAEIIAHGEPEGSPAELLRGGHIERFGGGIGVNALGKGGRFAHPVATGALRGGRHVVVETGHPRGDGLAVPAPAVGLIDDVSHAPPNEPKGRRHLGRVPKRAIRDPSLKPRGR